MDSLIKGYKQEWFMCFNIIFDMEVSPHAKLVYIYLCRCAGERAKSFPSKRTISKACSICRTSVYLATNELMDAGLLTKEPQYREGGKGQSSNLYAVYDKPIK